MSNAYAIHSEAIEQSGGVTWSFKWDREAALEAFESEVAWWQSPEYDFSVTLWAMDVAKVPETDEEFDEFDAELDTMLWSELPTRGTPPRELALRNGLGTARLIRRAWKYRNESEEVQS